MQSTEQTCPLTEHSEINSVWLQWTEEICWFCFNYRSCLPVGMYIWIYA